MEVVATDGFFSSLRSISNPWSYRNIKWWFKSWYYYLFAPRNYLYIKAMGRTNWMDRDHILVYAMFQVLSDFVEQELRDSVVDWDADDAHKDARDTMERLYDWYHNTYLNFDACAGFDESQRSESIFKHNDDGTFTLQFNEYEEKFYDEANRKEDVMLKELEANLLEILRIRRYMWT